VRPTFLPADKEAVAAFVKVAQKQEEAKGKLYWEQVRRLKHEAEFTKTGAQFISEEEEEEKVQQQQQQAVPEAQQEKEATTSRK
jgi:hypothetical protein